MVLKMKSKNIGKKIMNNKLVLKKRKIHHYAKKYIIKNGWNEKLFDLITKNGKFKILSI